MINIIRDKRDVTKTRLWEAYRDMVGYYEATLSRFGDARDECRELARALEDLGTATAPFTVTAISSKNPVVLAAVQRSNNALAKAEALQSALLWIATHDAEFGDSMDAEARVVEITKRANEALVGWAVQS